MGGIDRSDPWLTARGSRILNPLIIPMRILLVSTSSGSQGGGEIFLHYLGKALQQMGHEVGLWVSHHSRMEPLCQRMANDGVEILRVPYQNTYDLPGRSLQAFWHWGHRDLAIESWRAWKPDIIHLNKQNLEDGLDLVRALHGINVPAIGTIHITQSAEFLQASNARLRDTLSRWALRRSPIPWITVSDLRRQDLIDFLSPSSAAIDTIYNGIPHESPAQARRDCRRALGLSPEDLLVTMVGRLTAQKSPEVFLDQAAHMLPLNANVHFLWIGSGDAEKAFDARRKQLDSTRIHRLPWQDDIPSWLSASDIYVHTAAYEGLPLALLEAMGQRLPCITSPNILQEAAPLQALRSYQDGWKDLLEHADTRADYAHSCYRLFHQHFTADQMARRYETAYESQLTRQRAIA